MKIGSKKRKRTATEARLWADGIRLTLLQNMARGVGLMVEKDADVDGFYIVRSKSRPIIPKAWPFGAETIRGKIRGLGKEIPLRGGAHTHVLKGLGAVEALISKEVSRLEKRRGKDE